MRPPTGTVEKTFYGVRRVYEPFDFGDEDRLSALYETYYPFAKEDGDRDNDFGSFKYVAAQIAKFGFTHYDPEHGLWVTFRPPPDKYNPDRETDGTPELVSIDVVNILLHLPTVVISTDGNSPDYETGEGHMVHLSEVGMYVNATFDRVARERMLQTKDRHVFTYLLEHTPVGENVFDAVLGFTHPLLWAPPFGAVEDTGLSDFEVNEMLQAAARHATKDQLGFWVDLHMVEQKTFLDYGKKRTVKELLPWEWTAILAMNAGMREVEVDWNFMFDVTSATLVRDGQDMATIELLQTSIPRAKNVGPVEDFLSGKTVSTEPLPTPNDVVKVFDGCLTEWELMTFVRLAVMNPGASTDFLVFYALCDEPFVRRAVAEHPRTPRRVRTLIATITDPEVVF